ncbi:hypothetical protein GCM10023231_14040 [Olivibacter ginsenosidimutans]|uniref:HTH hxlR-type domain-containing protein n=1 Tax=Olivibacter ginsenosidimutans TaxID=1176537 RepID=A0ABP9AZB5_9SPHI
MGRLDNNLKIGNEKHFATELITMNEVLKTIGGKWKLKLILALTHGDKRFNELKTFVIGISPRALSKELKELERDGLVKRLVYDEPVLLVNYQLTEIAWKLNGVIRELTSWCAWYKEAFLESQPNDWSHEVM